MEILSAKDKREWPAIVKSAKRLFSIWFGSTRTSAPKKRRLLQSGAAKESTEKAFIDHRRAAVSKFTAEATERAQIPDAASHAAWTSKHVKEKDFNESKYVQ
eukprot:5389753-Pyramimonas_sp.AAC.1